MALLGEAQSGHRANTPIQGSKKINSNQPLAAAGLRRNGTTANITNRIDHSLRMNAQADQCIWINP
jgi:hypothetical protein